MKPFLTRRHSIHTFIDFTYPLKIDTSKLYKSIHEITIEIAKNINDIAVTSDKETILIYKILVSRDGLIIYNGNFVQNSIVEHNKFVFMSFSNIAISSESIRQEYVRIPKTSKEGFQMDEYIEFKAGRYTHEIQIEDSENLDKHKSNNVEFLLRQINKIDIVKYDEENYMMLLILNNDNVLSGQRHKWNSVYREYININYPNVNINECLDLIYNAPKEVVTLLILQDMGYKLDFNNGIYVIYQLMENSARIDNSPIYNAYPDFVKKYFKPK